MMRCLFAVLLFLSYRSLGVDRREGRILDDKTGQPVAATLLLADGEGRPLEIEGKHSHVDYLGRRSCYVDGVFTLSVCPIRLVVEIRPGLETLQVRTDVELNQRGTEALTFRQRRWIDMRELGYVSGDTQVPLLSQSKLHLQMRAEDLNVLNLLVSDFTRDREKFTGQLDAVSTPGHAVFVGQEERDWQHEHVCLLHIKRIVVPFGGTFQWTTKPSLYAWQEFSEKRASSQRQSNLPGKWFSASLGLGATWNGRWRKWWWTPGSCEQIDFPASPKSTTSVGSSPACCAGFSRYRFDCM